MPSIREFRHINSFEGKLSTTLDRYRVMEDDMKDVGREVFGIVYPGDPSTPKRVSSLHRNDEHAVRAAIADGVKHAVLLDTEDL